MAKQTYATQKQMQELATEHARKLRIEKNLATNKIRALPSANKMAGRVVAPVASAFTGWNIGQGINNAGQTFNTQDPTLGQKTSAFAGAAAEELSLGLLNGEEEARRMHSYWSNFKAPHLPGYREYQDPFTRDVSAPPNAQDPRILQEQELRIQESLRIQNAQATLKAQQEAKYGTKPPRLIK